MDFRALDDIPTLSARHALAKELLDNFALAQADGDTDRMARCLDEDPIDDPANVALLYRSDR